MNRPVSHGELVALRVALIAALLMLGWQAYELARAERPVHVHVQPAGAR